MDGCVSDKSHPVFESSIYKFFVSLKVVLKNFVTMKKINTKVLIIGGGCSGAAAGIQSARLGIETVIVEETPWLGGMITSAGVSAFDGNKYALGGGIFGELRKKIESHYGGADKTFTGWISLTCFEPSIAARFLHDMAAKEDKLTVLFQTSFETVIKKDDRICGAIVKNSSGELIEISSQIVIEATEFGDVIESAGIPYRLGRDAKYDTGEADAPDLPDDVVQDMTFCAILKKYPGKAPSVPASKNYNPKNFINSTSIICNSTDEKILGHKLHSWESFISYAALPNDKYLLNWPFHSNDYPTTIEVYNRKHRQYHYYRAKELTLDFVHYLQNELGHPEWGIAPDEFPTEDFLPFIPYVRESRRIRGLRLMSEMDVVPVAGSYRPELQQDSIAVGDYFLDHHHSRFFIEPIEERLVEELPANAPFQIPLHCVIPAGVKGLLAAEKSISVTHIVNGCTRLQPVVMLIGQAVGALAALSVLHSTEPELLPVSLVQKTLLDAGCQLFPYKDIWNSDPLFRASQELALKGVFIDEEDFAFHPDKNVTTEEKRIWAEKLGFLPETIQGETRGQVFHSLLELLKVQQQ